MNRLLIAVVLVACSTEPGRERSGDEPILEPVASPSTRSPRHPGASGGHVGVLMPRSSAEVVAPFTSTVAELDVKLGERVDRGQRLGRLDDRPLREELAIARASIRAAQADAAQAEIEHRAASSVLERERRAYQDGVTSMARVNADEFTERKAAMAVTRSAAAVEEQRARIAQLNAKLADATLVSPLAGKVALGYVQVGERVQAGEPIIRVISSDELYVRFAISADQAGTLAPGSLVDIVLEPQGARVHAIVRHVAPELDPIAQMILADADLVEPPPWLQSGMVCRIIPRLPE